MSPDWITSGFRSSSRSAPRLVASRPLRARGSTSTPRRPPRCWRPAYDLMVDQPKWVPWEAVSCDFSSALVQHATFTQTTNGLASGNHVLEAILHGLCEVIERDAITLHYCLDRTQQAERRIDLDTVQDRRCVQVLRTLDKAGIVVTVWDCTSDIGVPVLAASLLDSSAAQRIRA